ncbi:MAG: hypothetical protein ACE5I2_12255 [Anaerolineae bacterium]
MTVASCGMTFKPGLKLRRRRKKPAADQQPLVLLTDVGYNALAWVSPWMCPARPLAGLSTTPRIEAVLAIPGGCLIFRQDQWIEGQPYGPPPPEQKKRPWLGALTGPRWPSVVNSIRALPISIVKVRDRV